MTSKPRDRVVVFRVSQDEYRALKEACDRRGSRNLSDFARSEILADLDTGPIIDYVNQRFASIEQAISAVQSSLSHLYNLLRENNYVQPKSRR
jgi:hypothetical protein